MSNGDKIRSQEKEMEPCPFCGSDVSITYSSWNNCFNVYHSWSDAINGLDCPIAEPMKIDGMIYKTRKEAIGAWNRREQRPVAHWKDAKGNYVPFMTDFGNGMVPDTKTGGVSCSNCGRWLTASDEYACDGKYCPACGCEMIEPPKEGDQK